MGFSPSYAVEAGIYAKFLLKERPSAKVAIMFQNDDFGKDFLKGFKDALGDKAASMIVLEEPYDVSEPTIDSHIVKARASNADVFLDVGLAKSGAQAIKKIAELDWKPLHIMNYASTSIGTALKPAGLENAQGIVSAAYFKDPDDPTWKDDPGMKEFDAFVRQYFSEGNRSDSFVVGGYNPAQLLVEILKRCGDDLTRKNVMKQAANLKDIQLGMILPGITINTSPTDFAPIKQMQMKRFEGTSWQLFGEVISGDHGQ
jgi:branched-chain amino acid transport system substrate-binding protein